MVPLRNDAVLLYDGLCGFCDGVVQFLLARDRSGTLRFAPLQGEFAGEFFSRHPELRGIDSIVLVQPGEADSEQAAVRSDAAVQLAYYLGGGWKPVGFVLQLIPRFLRDAGYRLFASVRYRLFGTRTACRVPTASERARFIP